MDGAKTIRPIPLEKRRSELQNPLMSWLERVCVDVASSGDEGSLSFSLAAGVWVPMQKSGIHITGIFMWGTFHRSIYDVMLVSFLLSPFYCGRFDNRHWSTPPHEILMSCPPPNEGEWIFNSYHLWGDNIIRDLEGSYITRWIIILISDFWFSSIGGYHRVLYMYVERIVYPYCCWVCGELVIGSSFSEMSVLMCVPTLFHIGRCSKSRFR